MTKKTLTTEQIISKLRGRSASQPGADRADHVQGDWCDGSNLLPVAQSIRGDEDRPGAATEGAGAGKRQAEAVGGGFVVG